MKNTLLLLLLITMGAQCQAQRIRFSDTTNKWSLLGITPDATTYRAGCNYLNDTVIVGTVYHILSDLGNRIGIREDTVLGKLYCRFLSPRYIHANSTDTLEHLIFDYGLKVGDTFKLRYSAYEWEHTVQSIDSVKMGSEFYRLWKMHYVRSNTTQGGSYDFLEGIGTLRNPTFNIAPITFEGGFQLRCFSNQGTNPSCNPPVFLPFAFSSVFNGYSATVSHFDNANSCLYKKVGFDFTGSIANESPQILPSPCGQHGILKLPARLINCSLVVTDVSGRVMKEAGFAGISEIPIGHYITVAGTYFYMVRDEATGRRYTGRFIYR